MVLFAIIRRWLDDLVLYGCGSRLRRIDAQLATLTGDERFAELFERRQACVNYIESAIAPMRLGAPMSVSARRSMHRGAAFLRTLDGELGEICRKKGLRV